MELEKVRPRDLWYVVGLIATDGCIYRDGRHVNITSADQGHLEAVLQVLRLKNRIGRKSNGRGGSYFQIQIGSRRFVQFLTVLGLTPRKSLTLGPLGVPDEGFLDFLRGVIDGDGCIWTWIHSGNGLRQWALKVSSGSPAFALWLRARIEERFHVKGAVYRKRTGRENPIYELKFGKLAMKIILRACYDPGSVALERKRNKAYECLDSVNKHKRYGQVIPRLE